MTTGIPDLASGQFSASTRYVKPDVESLPSAEHQRLNASPGIPLNRALAKSQGPNSSQIETDLGGFFGQVKGDFPSPLGGHRR